MSGNYGDYSSNQPTLPNVGSNFGASGTYANYVLIITVPKDSSRGTIDVENTSGSQIVIVLDDGKAAVGSPPTNATVFSIAGGAGVGQQGGSWVSNFNQERVQIYAPSASAQVAVRVN